MLPHSILFEFEVKARDNISKLPTELAKHIRRRRQNLRLYQRQLAEIIDVTESTIYNWERGVEPELRFIPAIIRFLGYNPLPMPPADDPLEQLRHYKTTNGMDFYRLGKAMSKDHEQLADWLSGRHKPFRKSLDKIRDFLKMVGYYSLDSTYDGVCDSSLATTHLLK